MDYSLFMDSLPLSRCGTRSALDPTSGSATGTRVRSGNRIILEKYIKNQYFVNNKIKPLHFKYCQKNTTLVQTNANLVYQLRSMAVNLSCFCSVYFGLFL